MSTTTTARLVHPARPAAGPARRLLERLIEARSRQAERRIGEVLTAMSDERLRALGLSGAAIASLGATRRIPACRTR
jgi:hypothetical protein